MGLTSVSRTSEDNIGDCSLFLTLLLRSVVVFISLWFTRYWFWRASGYLVCVFLSSAVLQFGGTPSAASRCSPQLAMCQRSWSSLTLVLMQSFCKRRHSTSAIAETSVFEHTSTSIKRAASLRGAYHRSITKIGVAAEFDRKLPMRPVLGLISGMCPRPLPYFIAQSLGGRVEDAASLSKEILCIAAFWCVENPLPA